MKKLFLFFVVITIASLSARSQNTIESYPGWASIRPIMDPDATRPDPWGVIDHPTSASGTGLIFFCPLDTSGSVRIHVMRPGIKQPDGKVANWIEEVIPDRIIDKHGREITDFSFLKKLALPIRGKVKEEWVPTYKISGEPKFVRTLIL